MGWGIKRIVRNTGYAHTTVHRYMRHHGLVVGDAKRDAVNALRKAEATARKARIKEERAAKPAKTKKMPDEIRAAARAHYYRDHALSKDKSRARAKARYRAEKKARHSHARRTLATRIYQALTRPTYGSRWPRNEALPLPVLIGCSVAELRTHLESKFQPGMSWANYGDWHIDHKMPCESFDLTDRKEQLACFHWTNLQPLWAADNRRKGSRTLSVSVLKPIA